MLENVKFYLKVYSMIAIAFVGIRIFFKRKINVIDLAALIPTFIYVVNI